MINNDFRNDRGGEEGKRRQGEEGAVEGVQEEVERRKMTMIRSLCTDPKQFWGDFSQKSFRVCV